METNKLHGYLVILAGAVLAIIGLFTMIDSGYSACGMEFRPDLIPEFSVWLVPLGIILIVGGFMLKDLKEKRWSW